MELTFVTADFSNASVKQVGWNFIELSASMFVLTKVRMVFNRTVFLGAES